MKSNNLNTKTKVKHKSMKTVDNFSDLNFQSENILNRFEMNAIRGGSNTGGSIHIDEDILIPDLPKEKK